MLKNFISSLKLIHRLVNMVTFVDNLRNFNDTKKIHKLVFDLILIPQIYDTKCNIWNFSKRLIYVVNRFIRFYRIRFIRNLIKVN